MEQAEANQEEINQRRNILFFFTRELIRHSLSADIVRLQNMIQQSELESKKDIIVPIKPNVLFVREESEIPSRIFNEQQKKLEESMNKIFPEQPQRIKSHQLNPPYLAIPEIKLPPHLAYLRPIPTKSEKSLDLLKLNPLIQDPAVKMIIGNSENYAVVNGAMGTKPTNIFLTKEDVLRIIKIFSTASKIPINEGIYKVVVGNLIFSAVFSQIAGSRFIIKKMNYSFN